MEHSVARWMAFGHVYMFVLVWEWKPLTACDATPKLAYIHGRTPSKGPLCAPLPNLRPGSMSFAGRITTAFANVEKFTNHSVHGCREFFKKGVTPAKINPSQM